MFEAVAGLSASNMTADGRAERGRLRVDRVDDGQRQRAEAGDVRDIGLPAVGQRQRRATLGERRGRDLGRGLVDPEGVGGRRGEPGSGGWSGWPTTTATAYWKPSGSAGAVTVKVPVASVVVEDVVRARVAAAAAADREVGGPAVDAAELDQDLVAGDRAGERHVDLADELGLRDVGVLVAGDAGVRRRVSSRTW